MSLDQIWELTNVAWPLMSLQPNCKQGEQRTKKCLEYVRPWHLEGFPNFTSTVVPVYVGPMQELITNVGLPCIHIILFCLCRNYTIWNEYELSTDANCSGKHDLIAMTSLKRYIARDFTKGLVWQKVKKGQDIIYEELSGCIKIPFKWYISSYTA